MTEQRLALILALTLFAWMALSFSELDVRLFGFAIDGGLLRPSR